MNGSYCHCKGETSHQGHRGANAHFVDLARFVRRKSDRTAYMTPCAGDYKIGITGIIRRCNLYLDRHTVGVISTINTVVSSRAASARLPHMPCFSFSRAKRVSSMATATVGAM